MNLSFQMNLFNSSLNPLRHPEKTTQLTRTRGRGATQLFPLVQDLRASNDTGTHSRSRDRGKQVWTPWLPREGAGGGRAPGEGGAETTGPRLQTQSEKLTAPHTPAGVTLRREEASRRGASAQPPRRRLLARLHRERARGGCPWESAAAGTSPSVTCPPRGTSALTSPRCTRVRSPRVGSLTSVPGSQERGCLSPRQSLCDP